MQFRARIAEKLAGCCPTQIEEVTRQSSIFFDRRWFSMLESLDLSELLGGAAELKYVVVESLDDGSIVALCPFLVCLDANIYGHYNLTKLFFLSWPIQAARLHPGLAPVIHSLGALTRGFHSLVRSVGVRFDACVIAVSALSNRGGLVLNPFLSQPQRRLVIHTAIRSLKELAREQSRVLCFLAIDEAQSLLRAELNKAEFTEVFQINDHFLPLAGLASSDDYLLRFRSKGRNVVKREIRAVRQAGIEFRYIQEIDSIAPELARLYENTYGRYGGEYFRHPATFWSTLAKHLGPCSCALAAYRGRQLAGFSLLLKKDVLWIYRVGRLYDQSLRGLYFNLTFYQPIQYAIEQGLERIWLGPAASEAKHARGGYGHALYTYLWFPRRHQRWLLRPYLDIYSRTSRLFQARDSHPTSSLHDSGSKKRSP